LRVITVDSKGKSSMINDLGDLSYRVPGSEFRVLEP